MYSVSEWFRVVDLHIASAESYTEAKETSDRRVEDDDARAYPFLSTAALSSVFVWRC